MADITAAGAIVYSQQEKDIVFLILRSAKTGEWGPPKGHAEEGESEVETATREIFEEAGLRRISFTPNFRETLNYKVERKGKIRSKEVVYFLCEMESPEVRLSPEHTEAHLATLDEIEFLLHHEDTKAIFRKAAAYIEKKG